MSEVNGVSEQIKILFNEKTQDIKELLDCVKKCIEIIKELKRENEYLKTMNDGLEQQKAELIEIAREYSYLLSSQQTYDFNNEHDLKRGEDIDELLRKYTEGER